MCGRRGAVGSARRVAVGAMPVQRLRATPNTTAIPNVSHISVLLAENRAIHGDTASKAPKNAVRCGGQTCEVGFESAVSTLSSRMSPPRTRKLQ